MDNNNINNKKMLIVGSSPHFHTKQSVQRIMGLVIVALLPAGVAGVAVFGMDALLVILTAVAAAVLTEALWQKAAKRPFSADDLSAALTGLLLAYNLPPSIPLWMAAAGSVFAILIVKQLYGGIGRNIVNPALAARAFMLTCWPVAMTTWTLDGVTGATPLAILKDGEGALPSLYDAFMGSIGGCIGETSALALLAGGIFLIALKIISWHIPVIYIAVTVILTAVLGSRAPIYEICIGGLMLGAFFMATDYATSPMTRKGQVIFAIGCGILTALIRVYGGYPEGVSYSILIMNLTVPLIERATEPRIFGQIKIKKQKDGEKV